MLPLTPVPLRLHRACLSTALWGFASLAFTALAASASTYYVDCSAGSDASSGISASNPFQHCPGDAAAVGLAAATRLSSGDTVIFKGGVTYYGYITCTADGVTYDGNSAGAFGTGRAVFNGQNSTANICGFMAQNRTDLVFNNLEMELYGGHGSLPWTGTETRGYYGYALYLDECANVTVSHCYFHNIGDWQNTANANEEYMEGVGVEVIDSGTGITLSGNEFTRIGRAGVMIDPRQGNQTCTGISVTGNNFHDYIRWGVCLTTGNTHCTINGITIEQNLFHDIYEYATPQWLGLANDAPHVDCIIAYIGNSPPSGGQTLGTAANPIVVRNNFFYNNATVAQVQNSAIFLDTWGGRVLIYNNTFVNALFDGNGCIFCLEGTNTAINPPPDYWITNNSFYDSTYAVTLESDLYPLNQGDMHILNNIFFKPDMGAGYSVRIMDAKSIPTQLDYNVYDTGRSDNLLAFTPSGYRTLAQLQQAGYETHGSQANPLYANISFGLGASSSSNDLHLQPASPAIGAGLNLSTLFAADKDGNARPAGSPWDAGACEHQASSAGDGPGSSSAAPEIAVPASSSGSSCLSNVSLRAYASAGENVVVAGFVISGGSKTVLVRGIGPGLAQFGVSDILAAPKLSLYSGSTLAQANSGWEGDAVLQAAFAETGAFSLNPSSADSALVTTLSPGAYSAQVSGGAGNALAEVYDTAPDPTSAARLINVSGRALVGGGGALIVGFSVTGNGPETVLIRGVGPSLAQFGVAGFLARPRIDLYQGSSDIQSNSGWSNNATVGAAATQVGAFSLTSTNDAAIIAVLAPGEYTAQISSQTAAAGVALAEVYELPANF